MLVNFKTMHKNLAQMAKLFMIVGKLDPELKGPDPYLLICWCTWMLLVLISCVKAISIFTQNPKSCL